MEKILDNFSLSYDIERMNKFIADHGERAFSDAVFNGAFETWSFTYIHPDGELKTTPGFQIIQRAFINAYT
jgi:hypothetical protein